MCPIASYGHNSSMECVVMKQPETLTWQIVPRSTSIDFVEFYRIKPITPGKLIFMQV